MKSTPSGSQNVPTRFRVVVGKDDNMNAVALQTAEEGRDLLSGQGGLVRDHRAVQIDQRGADAVALQDLGRDVVYRVENVIGYEFAHSYTLSERTEKERSGFLQETFGLPIKKSGWERPGRLMKMRLPAYSVKEFTVKVQSDVTIM